MRVKSKKYDVKWDIACGCLFLLGFVGVGIAMFARDGDESTFVASIATCVMALVLRVAFHK